MLPRIIDGDGFNVVVKAKHGLLMVNKQDVYIGQSIEKYGEYAEAEVDLFKQFCRQGDVVVEVGANIGVHTLPLAKMVGNTGKVIAFEPQRLVFQTLCANMALNSLQQVMCYHMAVSSQQGILPVPDLPYDKPNNFGGVALKETVADRYASVPVVRLDDFFSLDKLRLLKVDVEGMEAEVIQGAKNIIIQYKPILYVENDRKEKSKELIELIQSLGYRLFWNIIPLFNANNFAGDSEDIFKGANSFNMLCIHQSFDLTIDRFVEVTDADDYPFSGRE